MLSQARSFRLRCIGATVVALGCLAGAAEAQTAAAPASPTTAPVGTILFDDKGLASLRLADAELLVSGGMTLQHLQTNPADGAAGAFEVRAKTFTVPGLKLEQTYSWGKLSASYEALEDGIAIVAEVHNAGPRAIGGIHWDLMQVRFPETPMGPGWKERWSLLAGEAGSLPAIVAGLSSGTLAVCNEDVSQPVVFGMRPTEQANGYAVTVHLDNVQIKPGETARHRLTIRMGGPGTPAVQLASKAYAAFASQHPFELKWTDRRPIGTAFLATSDTKWKTNPRGWLMDPTLDTTTDAGRQVFRERMMKYADEVVKNCRLLDAQGVLVWDVEGQEMPHAISYLGDPRVLPQAAPEMDAIADEFFARLTRGGLRTGVTIRPNRPVLKSQNPLQWDQTTVSDPVEEMSRKISYARDRWGCTMFYLDSNVFEFRNDGKLSTQTMPADLFRRLMAKYPDVLLIPEHETAEHWASTAPYNEYRQGYNGTPPDVRAAYPKAMSVLRVVDGAPLEDHWSELVASVRAGDVLLFRAWYDDPVNEQVKRIYAEAAK